MYRGYLTPEGRVHDADELSITSRVERKADPPFPTIVKPIRTETGLLLEISLPAEAIERAKLDDGTLEIRVITEPRQ